MSCCCPNCGFRLDVDDRSKRVARRVEVLKRTCAEHSFSLSIDGERVNAHIAAALLDKSPETLSGWRSAARRLAYRRIGGRIFYDLAVLAEHLEASAET